MVPATTKTISRTTYPPKADPASTSNVRAAWFSDCSTFPRSFPAYVVAPAADARRNRTPKS
ncbi:hypothetical protein AB0877_17155 [Micromonospora sp. NPDC047644]|uniref:hypothetical protein n=1 Tax=Micromonospora sp. NPDC047644 TaxID=3157203 RepID=UPI0034560916